MTFREKIIESLRDYGVPEKDACVIVERYLSKPISSNARDMIDQSMEGYPLSVLAVIWMGIKRETLVWIDETFPDAWFRPMFVPED